MTYLSRIRINPLRAESRKLLASPRAMHAAVVGGIPTPPDTERALWRLDTDNPHRPMLFVLSSSRPDWTHLVETAGWPDAEGEHASVRDYEPLLAQLALGREFHFRVTAHPVQNTFNPIKPTPAQRERTARGDRRAHRVSHRTAAAQLGWFLERSTKWGFNIPEARTDPAAPGLDDQLPRPAPDIRIIARDRQSFIKNGRGAPITLYTATFEGRLRITDTDQLTHALLVGIGPSKAYGCGLLTLAPLTPTG